VTGSDLSGRLIEAGLSEREARSKAALFETAEALLASCPSARFFVPGRIEVLGKHTDYAGGRSLLAAAERGFCVAAAPRPDRIVRLLFAGRETIHLPLDSDLLAADAQRAPHAAAAVRRLVRDFPGLTHGADAAFAWDLPAAAGLSSSSALVVGLCAALASVLRIEERDDYRAALRTSEDLAGYLGALESGRGFGPFPGDRGAGASIGSEDHTAILCCRAGCLSQYAFLPVRHERTIPLPGGWTFVIASSGVSADKTGGARERYNALARCAETILELAAAGGLLEATAGTGDADRIRGLLARSAHPTFSAAGLSERFQQLYEESVRIIPAAGDALVEGNVRALGSLAERSQELAECILRNQIPQTAFLARSARELGAAAASAFGAGFGGSVWALVEIADAGSFLARWREAYLRAFPADAGGSEMFLTRPGPPAQRL
jgi:galactokinase